MIKLNKPIDFQIVRINKNAQKICKCDPPQYEIDIINKLVQCTKCNAYVHPLDALTNIAADFDKYNDGIEKLNKEKNELIKEVNQLHSKRFRMNVFRSLQNNYMGGMVPYCPHCNKPFDPTEINEYTNKDYCDYKK